MGWQEHIIFNQGEYDELTIESDRLDRMERMKPGLTGVYNRELREKASIRNAPVPPEYMGLEGEYDPFGLAKRVAKALDSRIDLVDIKPLTLTQKGNAIVFTGEVPNREILDSIVDITSRVDGTHRVDVSRVAVEHTD